MRQKSFSKTRWTKVNQPTFFNHPLYLKSIAIHFLDVAEKKYFHSDFWKPLLTEKFGDFKGYK